MKIEQLEQVIKITQCGSFNKAAVELYVSQSNLSQSIKGLETELGHQIFERTGKGVELTNFGSEFLNHALATYNQFELTKEFSKTFSNDPTLHFSVASQYMRFANLIFIQMCKKYNFNNIEFSFLEGSFLEVLDNVLSNRSEIGLILLSNNDKKTSLNLFKARGLQYTPIKTCPPMAILGKNNPLYNTERSQISINELKNCPVIMYKDISFNFAAELINLKYYSNQNRIVVSDRSTLHEILTDTNAFSVGASIRTYTSENFYSNLRAIPLTDSKISFELGWVKLAGRPLSELASEYRNLVVNAAAQE